MQVDGKPVGKKRRWCGGCAAYHKGAVDRYPRCIMCGEKHRNYALPGEKNKKWCVGGRGRTPLLTTFGPGRSQPL